MSENYNHEIHGRVWKSHTMRTLDAALTPGTLPNAILVAGVTLALKKHRMHLMVASVAISNATELWNKKMQTRITTKK